MGCTVPNNKVTGHLLSGSLDMSTVRELTNVLFAGFNTNTLKKSVNYTYKYCFCNHKFNGRFYLIFFALF